MREMMRARERLFMGTGFDNYKFIYQILRWGWVIYVQKDSYKFKQESQKYKAQSSMRRNKSPKKTPQQPTSLTQLETKFEEEKQILIRENKRIQKQLYEEIEQNNTNRLRYEKKEQNLKNRIQQLEGENARIKSQLLMMDRNDGEFQVRRGYDEDEYYEMLQMHKQALEMKKELEEKMEEYIEAIRELEIVNQAQEEQNNQLTTKLNLSEAEIENCQNQINLARQNFQILEKESRKITDELQLQIENREKNEQKILKLNNKINTLKSKNQQYQYSITELENKLHHYQNQQNSKHQQQLQSWKQKEQSLLQEISSLTRKISFLEISVAQKQKYIEQLSKQLEDLKIHVEEKSERVKELTKFENNIHKTQNQNRRLIIEVENLRDRMSQFDEKEKKYLEDIAKIKQKTAQEVYQLCQAGGGRDAIIEKYMQGLRTTKSEMNFGRHNWGAQKNLNNGDFQKFKLQSQISNLNNELQAHRKHNQSLTNQNNRLKSDIQQKKQELIESDKKIKQLELTLDRNEHQKMSEEQKLRQQVRDLKNKETEYLQIDKAHNEMQDAMNLKVNFYERKIKELLETIERKQNVIQTLKNQRLQLQSRCRFLEQKVAKYVEEVEIYKKFKNDTNRKEDLLKDYKEKINNLKGQLEKAKDDLDKCKKQKNRIERTLDSKEQYLNTLKDKVQKQKNTLQHQHKEQLGQAQKEVKKQYQIKLKKYKKQVDEYVGVIERMRVVMIDKIEEILLETQEKQNIKNCNKSEIDPETNQEAAELLGLKARDIQQFVNPVFNLDRHICQDLDSLWDRGQYQDFMKNSLEYLLLKIQNSKEELL